MQTIKNELWSYLDYSIWKEFHNSISMQRTIKYMMNNINLNILVLKETIITELLKLSK